MPSSRGSAQRSTLPRRTSVALARTWISGTAQVGRQPHRPDAEGELRGAARGAGEGSQHEVARRVRGGARAACSPPASGGEGGGEGAGGASAATVTVVPLRRRAPARRSPGCAPATRRAERTERAAAETSCERAAELVGERRAGLDELLHRVEGPGELVLELAGLARRWCAGSRRGGRRSGRGAARARAGWRGWRRGRRRRASPRREPARSGASRGSSSRSRPALRGRCPRGARRSASRRRVACSIVVGSVGISCSPPAVRRSFAGVSGK